MGLFGTIMDKIFHHESAKPAPAPAAPAPQPALSQPAAAPVAAAPAAPVAAPATQQQKVDVEATLTQLAQQKGGGGNWRTSIVDLLKLLDLDSSLAARTELANELKVNVGAPGSPEQNIALQKAVMRNLAENGGSVPASLTE